MNTFELRVPQEGVRSSPLVVKVAKAHGGEMLLRRILWRYCRLWRGLRQHELKRNIFALLKATTRVHAFAGQQNLKGAP